MDGEVLQNVTEERDLGVIVQANLKVSSQCTKSVNRANQVLGMIYRTITCKNKEIILKLYKTLVRPHLEYCIQAWNPWLIKDIEKIERVQHRATRMIPALKKLTYENRLSELGITTLETRRLRGDLIEVFKILKGLEGIDRDKLFLLSFNKLRGHDLKLYKRHCRLDIRKYFFTQRIVTAWNNLPADIVACNTVNTFKNRLDTFALACITSVLLYCD